MEDEIIKTVFESLTEVLEKYIKDDSEADSGIIAYVGVIPPKGVMELSRKALHQLVSLKEVDRLLKPPAFLWRSWGCRRGLVGAMAAVGNPLIGVDYTYELLAYRDLKNVGRKRVVDEGSIFDASSDPEIFGNFDPETKRVLITPRGADPVLFGLRGERPEAVYKIFNKIIVHEVIDRWVIYITNQCTGSHLVYQNSTVNISPYTQIVLKGRLLDKPILIQGGHVILRLESRRGKIDCLAYAPTGYLSKKIRDLEGGDLVEIGGGVKPKRQGLTFNVEYLRVLETVQIKHHETPNCPLCHRRTSSLGSRQGYICKSCNIHIDMDEKNVHYSSRNIHPEILIPPPRSMRHLTKPLKRYGQENRRERFGISFYPWTSIYPSGGLEDARIRESL